MQNNDILVSVITPLYRGKKYIPDLLNMINQNAYRLKSNTEIRNIELILVNDDPEEQIILDKQNNISIQVKIIQLPNNLGVHGARIQGLRKAEGKYILFLDQDDYIEVTYLKSQLDYIGEYDAVICNGWYRNKRIIFKNRVQQEESVQKETYLKKNTIISPGQILIKHTSIPDIWKNNMLKRNGTDDVLLWIAMMKKGAKFSINESLLYTHNENGENNSFNWNEMVASRLEMLEIIQKEQVLDGLDLEIYFETHKALIHKYDLYSKIDSQLKGLSKDSFIELRDRKIAIYGMGLYGMKLYDLLTKNEIEVLYGIDQNANEMQRKIKIFKANESLPTVDLIIVTAVFAFDEIKSLLEVQVDCPIIRLDDFLENMDFY